MTLVERDDEALARGLANLRGIFEGAVKRGRLTAAAAAERMAGVTGATDYAALADTDLVIEAVFEELAVKRAVFDSTRLLPAARTRSSPPTPPTSTPAPSRRGCRTAAASSASTSSARPT